MTALKLTAVRCVCGWTGEIGSKAPCPACSRGYTHRINGAREDTLRALHRGEQPVMWPIVRNWLRWAQLIVPITARPAPSETRRRRPVRQHFGLTDAGRRAIGVADDDRGQAPQEESRRCAR